MLSSQEPCRSHQEVQGWLRLHDGFRTDCGFAGRGAKHDDAIERHTSPDFGRGCSDVSETDPGCAILLVDTAGSMLLYQRNGDDAASRQIAGLLGEFRQWIVAAGGQFIHSRGDDVLATFDDAEAALRVVLEILKPGRTSDLQFRVGLHFGPFVRTSDDIFGDAINLTARFAATANPGEAIISKDFVDRLPPASHSWLRYLDELTFKGKSQPQKVFTLATIDQTEIFHAGKAPVPGGNRYMRAVQIRLDYDGKSIVVGEAEGVSLGRLPHCNIIIDRQWVSRHHATIRLVDGRARLSERSSSGTYISMQQATEIFTRREDIVLVGSGKISPGLRLASPGAQIIHFTISY